MIVILGGGHHSDERLPITSQLSNETLKRLVEGIRLHRLMPGSKLLLSGGAWIDPNSNAEMMRQTASDLGINKEEMVVEDKSRDTRDEALLIKSLVGTNQFLLITSAWHLPRAMGLFRHEGMNPIPAPADHLVKHGTWRMKGGAWGRLSPDAFLPQPKNLQKSQWAAYEFLGAAWSRLRGAW